MPRAPRYLDQRSIEQLAAAQDGVLSRDQLAHRGAGRDYVAHRVTTRRWTAVGSRVVVLGAGTLTRRQQLWVATLHAGPESALAGLTALEAGGLTGFETSVLHVLVPHGCNSTDLDSTGTGVRVRVRQSRRLAPALLQPNRQPARLRLPEALVDAASQAPSLDRTRLLVIAAVQQRLVRPDHLRAVVRERPRLRRRPVIMEAIGDAEGGVHSLPERAWSLGLRRYGLPQPVRQQRVRRADGSWYLDADFQPWGVGVEINGVQHLLVATAAAEEHRRNVLGIGGRLMLTLASHTVRHRIGVAVVATAAALFARGWCPDDQTRRRLEALAAAEGMSLLTGDWLPAGERPHEHAHDRTGEHTQRRRIAG